MTAAPSLAPTAATATASASEHYRPSAGFVALMGLLAALGAVTTDMYLPSLPRVAEELGTSAGAAAFTISAVLIGGAFGQLLMGPLSDRFGRRRPALAGIALHVVASLLCMLAPSIQLLIALRILQGFGNSAATVTAMAVIRDRMTGSAAARTLSRLMLVIGVAPLLAPTVGGLIAGAAGWRAVFAVLALLGLALGAVVLRWLPETLPAERRSAHGVAGVRRGYATLLADRGFMAMAVLPGLVMGALLSYVAVAPFVLQEGYGLTEAQFALVFAVNGLGGVLASQANAALVPRFGPLTLLRIGLPTVLCLALALLAVAVTGVGGLPALLVMLWLVMSATMMLPANAAALALSRHGESAGSAAALVGSMQAGIAGLVSPIVGLLGADATAMGITIVGTLLAACLVLAAATRRSLTQPAAQPA